MNNFFQNLLNILTSPVSFFILFALIGGIGRFASWAKDQRVKRDALAARKAAQAEALRTGRSSPYETGPVQVSATAQEQQAAANTAAERQARLRQMQEQRAAQLRELQQKRLAELRARRAAQQSGQAPPPQSPPRSVPQARPQPGRQPAPGTRPAPPTQARGAPVPRSGPQPAMSSQRAPTGAKPPKGVEVVYGRKGDRVAKPDPFAIDRHDLSIAAAIATSERAKSTASAFDVRRPGKKSKRGAIFGSRDDLRRGIIAAEILGKPIALREED